MVNIQNKGKSRNGIPFTYAVSSQKEKNHCLPYIYIIANYAAPGTALALALLLLPRESGCLNL